jgi:hypothetical protein
VALSLDAAKVMAEVTSQKKARDKRLEGALDLVQKYPGPWWDGTPGEDAQFDPENAAFELISYQMTQLVWANPRWSATTRRPRAQQMVAESIQYGMNRWTTDSDFKTTIEDLAVDNTFCWGVAHTTLAPMTGNYEAEDAPLWPQVSRVSPWDFGFDHRAPTWRRARMLWHEYSMDLDDLRDIAKRDREQPKSKRAGWDMRAIDKLQPRSDEAPESKLLRAWGHESEAPTREQVRLVQVYFPGRILPGEPGPDEGFNGAIATYAIGAGGEANDAVLVQRPRAFFGPRWGPYTVIGTYIVPDCAFPLSLLMATAGHIAQSTRLAQAVDQQVAAYKRFGVVSSKSPTLAKIVRDGKNDHIFSAEIAGDVRELVQTFEYGGTTPGNVAAEQRVLERRNRAMGMDDVQRGHVSGDGTATEVQHAVEAALGRQGYQKTRFQDGIRRIGRTVAWYLFHTDEIVFPLGPEAAQALGIDEQEEAWFHGGDWKDGSGTTFDDLALELEPFSMERPSEAGLQRRGAFLAHVAQLAPALPALAQVGADVRGFLDAWGDANGMPHLSALFPNVESVDLSMIQPMQAQPRLARDVGVVGLVKNYAPKGLQGVGRAEEMPEAAAFGVE